MALDANTVITYAFDPVRQRGSVLFADFQTFDFTRRLSRVGTRWCLLCPHSGTPVTSPGRMAALIDAVRGEDS